MINAATAADNSCTVVTADYRDFRGAVNCFNPLTFEVDAAAPHPRNIEGEHSCPSPTF